MENADRQRLLHILREHEIGSGSPYRLAFARKDKSGGSFGACQGDMQAQEDARKTMRRALERSGMSRDRINAIVASLSQPCPENPLDDADYQACNRALESCRDLVDEMDGRIFAGVCRYVDDCLEAARSGGRTVNSDALVYIGLWINMSGVPTKLKDWLAGQPATLGANTRVDPPGPVVDGAAMERYLAATKYAANPRNFERLKKCVAHRPS